MAVEIPHFGFPFALGYVVEQDSEEHIMSCEHVIASCPVGFRVERPDFGIPWPEYRSVVDAEELAVAMRRLEPRSRLSGSEVRDLQDASQSNVTIEVQT